MTADYLKKSTARGGSTLDAYAQELRKFMTGTYWPALASGKNPDVSKYTPSAILALLNIGSAFNIYDTRMSVPRGFDLTKLRFTPWYDFSFFEERALNNVITKYLPDHVNYKTTSKYINASWKDWFNPSEGAWESWEGSDTLKNGLPDIVATIGLDPAVKLLTVHGYYDSATYFFRTELDLKGVVLDKEKNITLLDRVPVKNFAGGHMIYYSEEARVPLKRTLDEFYDAPPYGTGPTVVKAEELARTLPVQRVAAPVKSMHQEPAL